MTVPSLFLDDQNVGSFRGMEIGDTATLAIKVKLTRRTISEDEDGDGKEHSIALDVLEMEDTSSKSPDETAKRLFPDQN